MHSSARFASSHAFRNYRGATADREQGSVEEVLYLHSLWRQGPPLSRTRVADVSPSEEGNRSKRAKIEPPSEKKKNKKNKKKSKEKKKREIKEKKQLEKPSEEETPEETGKPQEPGKTEETENANKNWTDVSDWDTNKPAQSTDCWGHSPNRKLAEPLTEGEQLHLANINLQHKAVRAFKDFLTRDGEDESSEEDDEDEEEVEEDEVMAIDAASVPSGGAIKREDEAQKFFVKLFEEDQELRQFYERNCNCGVFECLVCAAVGAKLGKRFPDCVSLIQHAMKIIKTKKKAAHRGYGRSICCLLGWSADRLPSGGKPIESQPRGCIPPPDEEVQEQLPKKDDNGKENEPIGENVSEDATDKPDDAKPASS